MTASTDTDGAGGERDRPPDESAAPTEAQPTEHYFSPRSDLGSRRRLVDLTLPDLTTQLVSDRGVFSAERIDPGTRLLLANAPPPGPGLTEVLDLGTGYGVLARVLAHRVPGARVWAVDVNPRARALAGENLVGFDRAVVCAPDEVPEAIRFDLVWSNPPIRIGKPALHRLLAGWLDRLTPQGSAVLVVHRHLGADSLARWLADRGHPVTRLCSRQGYRLLEVGPREDPDGAPV